MCIICSHLLGLQNGDGDLVPISGLDETLKVAMGGLVRDPAGLLGVVGFGLKLLPQLVADDQPRGGVGVPPFDFLEMAGHGEKWVVLRVSAKMVSVIECIISWQKALRSNLINGSAVCQTTRSGPNRPAEAIGGGNYLVLT